MATEPGQGPDQALPARRLQPGQAAAIWGVVAVAWAVFLLPAVLRHGRVRARWLRLVAR